MSLWQPQTQYLDGSIFGIEPDFHYRKKKNVHKNIPVISSSINNIFLEKN